jgi:predicted FMN-binding regulatory protein PaiB
MAARLAVVREKIRKNSSHYEAMAIFKGQESYIRPSWIPPKHQHGKAVHS